MSHWTGLLHATLPATRPVALLDGNENRCLVASDDDVIALEHDPDLEQLHPVLLHDLDRKGPWLLAQLNEPKGVKKAIHQDKQ